MSAIGAKKRSTADHAEGTDLRDREIIILNDPSRESSKEQHGRVQTHEWIMQIERIRKNLDKKYGKETRRIKQNIVLNIPNH